MNEVNKVSESIKSEIDNIPTVGNKLRDDFFGTTNIGKAIKKKEPIKTDVSNKHNNRRHTEQWDIKFSTGSLTFVNIINFMSEIGYDIILKFRKNEMVLYIIDPSNTHVSHITMAKTEFAEYEVVGLTKDGENNEKVVYLNISIVEDLMINEDHPIDVYIDTLKTMMYHIVNGKEIVSRRLNSMSDDLSHILLSYKEADQKLQALIADDNYQRVTVVYTALKNVMNSISKKAGKDKDTALLNIHLGLHDIDFRIEKELTRSSILLSGEDLMVYPMRPEVLEMKVEYFKIFGKLELGYPVKLYCCESMPLVFETKLGGGGIRVYFIVAPRVNIDDQ
jgi:hypothetical protein